MQPSVHRAPLPSGSSEASGACRPRSGVAWSSTRKAAAIDVGVLEHVRIAQADLVGYAEDPPYAAPVRPEAYPVGQLVLVRRSMPP